MAATDALAFEAATRWVLVGSLVLLFGGEPRFLAITTTTVLVLATFVLAPPTVFRDRSFFGVTEVTRDGGGHHVDARHHRARPGVAGPGTS